MTTRYIPNSLQPKSTSQFQIESSVKCTEILSFCQKDGRVMQNHELRIHSDKMYAKSITGNTPNTPQFIQPICPNWSIIWDIFENSPHHMSIVHDDDGEGGGETPYFLCAIVQLLSQKALG